MNVSFIRTFFFLLSRLDKRNKINIYQYCGLSIASSISEFIAIASLLPFIAFITNQKSTILDNLLKYIHPIENVSQIFIVGGFFFISNIISGLLKIIVLKKGSVISFEIGSNLNKLLLSEFLYSEYEKFILKSKSQYIDLFTSKISSVINNFVLSILSLINSFFMILMISILLLIINTKATIFTFFGLSVTYALVILITKRSNIKNSLILNNETKNIINVINDCIGNIREITISSSQYKYIEQLLSIDKKIKQSQSKIVMISQSPKFIIESIGLCVVGLVALSIGGEVGIISSLPFLAILALSAQKLLPCFQLTYLNYSIIKSSEPSALELVDFLNDGKVHIKDRNEVTLSFNRIIEISNINFNYINRQDILKNLNFKIFKGDRIGIIGKSGSGKSTLVDLIVGLLFPKEGNILIDGIPLCFDNVLSWQKRISIVSQGIHIINGSILDNITLDSSHEINYSRVWESIKIASLSDFVCSLPGTINYQLSDNGGTLSGGQRQRIGIARAIYRGGDVFIFDEATSALDRQTSIDIMGLIYSLPLECTVFIIAHDHSLLNGCNKLLNLDELIKDEK